MKKQQRLDAVFMNMAKEVAILSHCVRSKVGALIVKDNNVVSMGYNGMPSGMDNDCETKTYVQDITQDSDELGNYKLETKREVLHAESNAILKAAKSGFSTDGGTLYLTTSPCVDCAKLIMQSGIKRVVYLEEYRDIAGLTFLKDFVKVEQITYEI